MNPVCIHIRLPKSTLLLLIRIVSSQILFAQNSSREVINFDHGWEMYCTNDTILHQHKNISQRDVSFKSQFNDEHVGKHNTSVDSIINREITEAQQGFSLEYPKIKSLEWETISLPHPARYEQALNPGAHQFSGICYYRKEFMIPADCKDKRLSVLFEGAMQVATVWINGKFVMQHQGGYLPFTVSLDKYVNLHSVNEIIVRLDNRDNRNTPPGKSLATLGFLYWSGIYRDAWLIATGPIHITDPVQANTIAGGGVFVRYENVSDCKADILIKTEVENSLDQNNNAVVKQIISDNKGKQIKVVTSDVLNINANTSGEVQQKISLSNPHLWSTDDPYLYKLTTRVLENGKLLDEISQHIGIRSLSYTRWEGFKLNGKPLRIVGTNRHQDYPYIGNALSNTTQYRDLKRIKESGMNFVRLAHYPNDPSVYDVCDSLGLMVVDPIPGWQFFNANDIFKERVYRDIREMIRRDRNHPCVIMWEVSLNESYPPDSFRIKSALLAHEEYPGDQFFTSGDSYGAKKTAWDVPYNSWIDPFGRPQNVQPERPGFAREYGDYEFGGSQSTTRVNRSNGEKALLGNAWNLQWEHNLLQGPEYYPWTVGDANWAFFDSFEATSTTTSDWGIVDVFRIPKFSYYFFQSQMDPYAKIHGADNKPLVHVANWWAQKGTSRKIVVYSNCDEIGLYVNGKLVKKQKPDNGPDSNYGDWEKSGNPFDGGNCRNLAHSPFTFENIQWKPGEIKAIGYIKDRPVAYDIVHTPEKPYGLHINVNSEGKPLVADDADVVFVNVNLIDKNGTVEVLDNGTQIKLDISGNAVMVSPAISKVRGGIASFLIRSTEIPGLIRLKASVVNSKQSFTTNFQFHSVEDSINDTKNYRN
ncbi:MAG: glycoside hydrolase family 2 TIM barrel-domain containing protein [Ginsengibacter sp.]